MRVTGFVSDEAEAAYHRRIDDLNRNPHFQIIGHGSQGTYVLVNNPRRLLVKEANQIRMPVFLAMAPLAWWAEHFPSPKSVHIFDKTHAVDFIFRAAEREGSFELLAATDGD